jgi:phage baseplate assembly protein W
MTERAISLPFSFNSTGQVAYSTDERKIIQDRVVLAVMSRLGERVMRPNFGSEVHYATFESQGEAASIITQAVSVCFSTWFGYLELEDVLPSVDADGVLQIEVTYKKALQKISESLLIKTSLFTRSGDLIREAYNG